MLVKHTGPDPTAESVSLNWALKYAHAIGVSAAGKSKIHPASKNTASEKVKGRAPGVGRGKEESKKDWQSAHKIKGWPRSLSFPFPHL